MHDDDVVVVCVRDYCLRTARFAASFDCISNGSLFVASAQLGWLACPLRANTYVLCESLIYNSVDMNWIRCKWMIIFETHTSFVCVCVTKKKRSFTSYELLRRRQTKTTPSFVSIQKKTSCGSLLENTNPSIHPSSNQSSSYSNTNTTVAAVTEKQTHTHTIRLTTPWLLPLVRRRSNTVGASTFLFSHTHTLTHLLMIHSIPLFTFLRSFYETRFVLLLLLVVVAVVFVVILGYCYSCQCHFHNDAVGGIQCRHYNDNNNTNPQRLRQQ